MHRPILGAGHWRATLAATAALATAAHAADRPGACPPASAAVHEQFIAADCEACWSGQDPAAAQAGTWRFDWIVPAGAGAPMAPAALRDAQQRLERVGMASPPAGRQTLRAQPAPAAATAPVRLTVSSGLPLSGYYGLQLSLQQRRGQRLPVGSSGWLALVELLPAGSDGSAQPRALLRSVAGPLPLGALRPGQPLNHLAALRWPEGTQVDRLQARGWVEGPDGALLAVAADRCGGDR